MRDARWRQLTGAAILVIGALQIVTVPASALAATIIVDTSSDADAADGHCSLREAIIATNVGGGYRECPAGTTGTDTIRFDDSISFVNVSGSLPSFLVAVFVKGHLDGSNVELHGDGTGTGLNFAGSGSSSVRDLHIDNFANGIESDGGDLLIAGNVIGPNTGAGIEIYKPFGTTTVGGTNSATPVPCSDDCNLITGNGYAGIHLNTGSAVIKGNFVGVSSSGTSAVANLTGIYAGGGTATIGGVTAAERNVISGNTHDGLLIGGCTCTVQGNYVGTNAAGSAAIANGATGITVNASRAIIGGETTGAGNLVSGNVGDGIYSVNASSPNFLNILGNRIGTKASGAALGNGGDGIHLTNGAFQSHVSDATIGNTGAGANTIAYNGGAGVHINGSTVIHNHIRGNSIHDNAGKGILLESSANEAIAAPSITGVSPVKGTTCPDCLVDVFSDAADEGKVFQGTTVSDHSGNWTYSSAVTGPNVTATTTDAAGNTSQFSAPAALTPRKPDARIKKGSGALVGNNIYNTTGLNQTKSGSAARGSTITFTISIQNDAKKADRFKVVATGTATTGYTVKYYRGTTEITAAVVAGTYQTASVSAGGTFAIKAKVKIGSGAAVGSSVSRLVTVSSVGDASRKDAVKFTGKRK